MDKKWILMLIVGCLLAALACSCGASQAELDAKATELAGSAFATQTASVPTEAVATATDTPAPTDTPVPADTPVPTDTPVPPADTPKPTDTPLPPTDTPIRVTPTATAGPPTATPVLQPVTFLLTSDNRHETVAAHQPVIAQWRWGVCRPEAMQEHLDSGTFEITVDGSVVATGNMAEYRSEVRQEELGGRAVWLVYYSYPMGAFESGSFHWLELDRRYSSTVTDGCDSDEDGQLDTWGPGTWMVVRLEITVR